MIEHREKYGCDGSRLAEVLTRIRLENRPGHAFDIFKEFVEDTGFRRAICFEIFSDGVSAADSELANTAFDSRKLVFNWDPFDWISHYIKENYYPHDPGRWLLKDHRRLYFTQEEMVASGPPELADILKVAVAPPFNFKEGIVIPLVTDFSRFFAISLNGGWGSVTDLSAEGLSALIAIAHATMTRESALSAEGPQLDGMPSLTKAQQETIDLLMDGCSEQETAEIRGVSTNAVFMARRLLKKKFAVSDMAELKAAYSLKLIMQKRLGSAVDDGV